MRVRWRAKACVVVPALIAIAVPGCTNSTARRAIASLAGRSWLDLASKPGSSVLPRRGRVAPPWTLETSPRLASASRSRRMVMSETPSSSVRSLTRTPPLRWSSSRIRSCRWAGSISSTVLSHDGHRARGQRQPPGDRGAGEQLQPARLQRRRLAAVVDGEQPRGPPPPERSEEHTSELQSRRDLVCRLLLEKKKKNTTCFLHISINKESPRITPR